MRRKEDSLRCLGSWSPFFSSRKACGLARHSCSPFPKRQGSLEGNKPLLHLSWSQLFLDGLALGQSSSPILEAHGGMVLHPPQLSVKDSEKDSEKVRPSLRIRILPVVTARSTAALAPIPRAIPHHVQNRRYPNVPAEGEAANSRAQTNSLPLTKPARRFQPAQRTAQPVRPPVKAG